ncbi:MAG TPA: hypothetical protein PKW90_22210, partial [Myxococcota bacterium]|nr:hypothetical protein [Myxococcota bacterium]
MGTLANAGSVHPFAPAVWILPVASGAVSAGDSVRPVASGRWVDAGRRGPSILHPWVVVRGFERAPRFGYWRDADGDGKADHLELVFSVAPRRSAAIGATWTEPDGTEVPVAVDSLDWVPVPGAVHVSLPAGPFASGTSWVRTGTTATWTTAGGVQSFPILDSLAPRLQSARLVYGPMGGPDTLLLSFTEPLVQPASGVGSLSRLGAALPVGVAMPNSIDGRAWRLPVAAGSVEVDDSVRPQRQGPWLDSSSNTAPSSQAWVPVVGSQRAPVAGWFLDQDGNGSADRLVLSFGVPGRRPAVVSGLWTETDGSTVPWRIDSSAWWPQAAIESFPVGPFARGTTSLPPLSTGIWISGGVSTPFPLLDSLGPVLVRAQLRYASAEGVHDTLFVRWSETGRWGGAPAVQWVGQAGG